MLKKGLSQADLARGLSLTEGSITGWMNGSRPRKITFIKLAAFLGVTLESLETDNVGLENTNSEDAKKNNDAICEILEGGSFENLIDAFDELYNTKTLPEVRSFLKAFLYVEDEVIKEVAASLLKIKKPLEYALLNYILGYNYKNRNKSKKGSERKI